MSKEGVRWRGRRKAKWDRDAFAAMLDGQSR
jgi:hypothetical protein